MFEVRSLKNKVILQIILLLMTIPYAIPLVQMFLGSLGGTGFSNYKAVWDTGVVPTYFRNSLIITAGVIILVYIFSMTAGFGFAKLHIFGKEVFFWMILIALTLPEVIMLSPLFVTFQKMHMFNTFWAVILPSAALQLPFSILLARNFATGIPDELMEAARIDGANVRSMFWYIILPLTKPIASSIIVLTFINAWNSYLLPLLFLQSPSMQTVTLLPQYFQGEFTNDQTKILAAAVITAIPEIIVYLSMQKNFEKGMSAGALK
ncbi:carbohydrate ABC transporter permease [Faecalicatena orotica]|uniref:Carbohydrate ABC transporter membrane protein 2 (CUT1 family) n=1 Tax=Faecalicatena orotica TaxID=1544 RepID=A0A2Y9BJ27_9FIRM|nr:carbohydrate ABC transporter permease [Faecalicatena orotica]PWJ22899.1 carbohydrate ABC transporter membrane protein 2 (CUT1 family) [Faecalicatena orotica]SSA58034.1 carbohydrate ABC transporter membrane protein 2, CUT1 family [Faecalicatena orotica]